MAFWIWITVNFIISFSITPTILFIPLLQLAFLLIFKSIKNDPTLEYCTWNASAPSVSPLPILLFNKTCHVINRMSFLSVASFAVLSSKIRIFISCIWGLALPQFECSVWNVYYQVFCSFLLFFFATEFYMFEILIFYQIYGLQIFSFNVFLFCWLFSPLCRTFYLIPLHSFILAFVACAFGIWPRNHYQYQYQGSFSYIFSMSAAASGLHINL